MARYQKIRYVTSALIVFFIVSLYHHFYYTNVIHVKQKHLKYILQWTKPYTKPFDEMKSGQTTFEERNCDYTNCFVTSQRSYLKSLTDYEAIVFHGPELTRMKNNPELPELRDPGQKYIFVSIESSHNYPLCSPKFNNFFNWTWTYRLDSDVPYAYITVRDSMDNVIGPIANVKWISQAKMDPISKKLKNQLKSKRKAAAWMVSNCYALMRRQFVKELREELRKYDLDVDVYGRCGSLSCPLGEEKCQKMIEREYYFYLAFENSFSADYVTEKLLLALQNSAVPVVLGAANYSRFMPPGIYLDALELGPKKLAARMHELISRPEEYHNMFRWRNHYLYHAPDMFADTDPLCTLCQMLNDEELMTEPSIYESFGAWWHPHRKTSEGSRSLEPVPCGSATSLISVSASIVTLSFCLSAFILSLV